MYTLDPFEKLIKATTLEIPQEHGTIPNKEPSRTLAMVLYQCPLSNPSLAIDIDLEVVYEMEADIELIQPKNPPSTDEPSKTTQYESVDTDFPDLPFVATKINDLVLILENQENTIETTGKMMGYLVETLSMYDELIQEKFEDLSRRHLESR
ncbi:hypothetical protein L2E82_45197 [Cichorium intybus]|uniref:Uncharacterized protein n=1 Tax=Cichorium intybus TaxID=13427 RepID=A0ACB8ZTN7_CICIN|nr:hypothetical protein L2E82_45197 [Cichorium intybus]